MADGWPHYIEVRWHINAGKRPQHFGSHGLTIAPTTSVAELDRITKMAMELIHNELEKAEGDDNGC